MPFSGSQILDRDSAFASSVRAFLTDKLTEDLRLAGRQTVGTHSDINASQCWHRILHERGWIAPGWPVEHGGTGWSPQERLYFEKECALNDAPVLFAGGIRNVGPLLIARGTEAQKEKYLPRILSGADRWCQGYSEPGAGSDLAGLSTRAVREGNIYRLSGRKIWTTGADIANKMFVLVRTDAFSKPQAGITFLLVDMKTPGIEVRPIQIISGEAEFCEVVFDGAAVPAENRVGEENEGWDVAKQLMRYARSSNTTSALLWRAFNFTRRLSEEEGSLGLSSIQQRLAGAECRLLALEAIEVRTLSQKEPEATTSSLMKTLATELHQLFTEMYLEMGGMRAFPLFCAEGPDIQNTSHAHAAARYFATRAASIYSGTNEVHRNIIGRHITGL